MKFLIVIDMQNDFIDGVLGTKEAQVIVPLAYEKIRNFEGKVIATMDTHDEDYLNTQEGKLLPVSHCTRGADGWDINDDIYAAICKKPHRIVSKYTFGKLNLPKHIEKMANLCGDEVEAIELIGVCTDICVINNDLILKAAFPEVPITVDATCCAGVTPELHEAALKVMKSCQIIVKED